MQGAYISALQPEAMEQLALELDAKEKKGQCRVILRDDIKDNPPTEMKVPLLAMIPHKSRLFQAILDLSFSIRLVSRKIIESFNETSKKTAPQGAIDQLGHSLTWITNAFPEAEDDAKIFMAKWDIKGGFWRLDC